MSEPKRVHVCGYTRRRSGPDGSKCEGTGSLWAGADFGFETVVEAQFSAARSLLAGRKCMARPGFSCRVSFFQAAFSMQCAALELAEHAGARDIQAGGDVVGAQALSPKSPSATSRRTRRRITPVG